MKNSILALAAAATIAAGTLAAPHPAEARCDGCVAAGVIGGIAAGAIIGSAIANSDHHHHRRYYDHDRYYRYRPVRGYVAYGDYYEPAPVACPDGYWARRRIYNRWGRFIGWSRPHYFCP